MPIRSNTSIKILLKNDTRYYLIGSFDITTPQNEFFYRPSKKIFTRYGIGTISHGLQLINIPLTSFEHLSFHSDGRIHFKDCRGHEHIILTNDERLDINQTGFAYLFWEAVSKLEEFPLYEGLIEAKDIVKEVNPTTGLIMKVCLIASTNLCNRNIELANPEEGFIDFENRATANPQRMLSFIFCNYTLTPPGTRRIFIPYMRGTPADEEIRN